MALLFRSAAVLVGALLPLVAPASALDNAATKAPEFPTQDPSRWVGPPVRLVDLRGKVVLLDVWTFG